MELTTKAEPILCKFKALRKNGVKSTVDHCKTIQDANLNKRTFLKFKNKTEKLKTG